MYRNKNGRKRNYIVINMSIIYNMISMFWDEVIEYFLNHIWHQTKQESDNIVMFSYFEDLKKIRDILILGSTDHESHSFFFYVYLVLGE